MNENKLIKLGVAGAVIVGIGVIGGFKFFEKIDNG
ncbi:prohibitin family protein, partial [Enterococcus faecium]